MRPHEKGDGQGISRTRIVGSRLTSPQLSLIRIRCDEVMEAVRHKHLQKRRSRPGFLVPH